MQVKKFEAPTLQEALESIKKELGPEAIILQTKQNKKAFGLMNRPSIEVTAAVSERSILKKKYVESTLDEGSVQKLRKYGAEAQANMLDQAIERKNAASQAIAEEKVVQKQLTQSIQKEVTAPRRITATRYADIIDEGDTLPARAEQIDRSAYVKPAIQTKAAAPSSEMNAEMMNEVKKLKEMVSELAQENQREYATPSALSKAASQEAYETLILNGIEKRLAFNLVKTATNRLPQGDETIHPDELADAIAMEFMNEIPIRDFWKDQGARVVAFVGPTGVGKTTTLAKVASLASLKHGLRVALINLDTYRVAAVDQLSTYAQIMNVPFRTAHNKEELEMALKDFSTRDLVLIDTTGRSQKDLRALQEMREVLASIPWLECELVISASTRDAELTEVGKRFSIFKPRSCIYSKVDEAITFGSLYNFSKKMKLPYSFFTTGQRVPEDIEDALAERAVSLLMDL